MQYEVGVRGGFAETDTEHPRRGKRVEGEERGFMQPTGQTTSDDQSGQGSAGEPIELSHQPAERSHVLEETHDENIGVNPRERVTDERHVHGSVRPRGRGLGGRGQF